jgi:hypothetical protein
MFALEVGSAQAGGRGGMGRKPKPIRERTLYKIGGIEGVVKKRAKSVFIPSIRYVNHTFCVDINEL